MRVLNNGYFTLNLDSGDLAKGLRKDINSPRNNMYLTKSQGAVGKDSVLQTIPQLTGVDFGSITASYPYPQLFKLKNVSILCTEFHIYELVDDSWTLKYYEDTETQGFRWTLVDFFDYIYMSNGVVAIIRNDQTGEYSESSDLPAASAMCDFNGQVIICPSNIEKI